jgi:hypothetical protein
MHIIKSFSVRPQEREVIIEKVYFKYGYKKFIAQYYPSRPQEKTLWAIALKGEVSAHVGVYYLGEVIKGRLLEVDYYQLRQTNDWPLQKGADRLYKLISLTESTGL